MSGAACFALTAAGPLASDPHHDDQSSRFGGRRRFPQWNCNGRNSADVRKGTPGLVPRTQASVAVSADGKQWVLLNAAPDLRQQINDTPELHPAPNERAAQQPDQGGGADQWRCRCHGRPAVSARRPAFHHLRDARACSTCSPQTASSTYSMSRSVKRIPMDLGRAFAVEGPSRSRPASPSSPLPCRARSRFISRTEDAGAGFGTQEGDTAGLKVTETASGHHFFYIPGCAKLDDALRARLKGAPLLFFDGTLYTNDEMIAQGLLNKTGRSHWPYEHVGERGHDRAVRAAQHRPQDLHPHQQLQSGAARRFCQSGRRSNVPDGKSLMMGWR